ncbi:MAG: methylenetetrahydrofolate--tRNA-(uracil(54)-C(5))-methyltransferase (FADH(2)-oxidizing) TrmFO [candidate division WOR-3 bacterium]
MALRVKVIGGGLAGSEAAWTIANQGIRAILYEMRPRRMTPAHSSGLLGELVCSNSLKSKDILSAQGILKEELKRLGSLIMEAAERSAIPGGKALVVDRKAFASYITKALEDHPNVEIRREEVRDVPEPIAIIATGPLTSDALAKSMSKLIGQEFLYFYDALSPIVSGESLEFSRMFWADRHGWEQEAYLNAPMTKEEYTRFYEALISAETHRPHFDERIPYFEGCLPIEVMAARGPETLIYGPMRPSGLKDPATGKEPYAAVQLRPENAERTAFSLVGFQTQLRIPEQERVFRMIPGLERAEFLRYGAVHRNTYLNAPALLKPTLELIAKPGIFVAGQLSGTEGYMEAAAGGLLAGLNAARLAKGEEALEFPAHTGIGTLFRAITAAPTENYQPTNLHIALFRDVPEGLRGKTRREFIAERAKRELDEIISSLGRTL